MSKRYATKEELEAHFGSCLEFSKSIGTWTCSVPIDAADRRRMAGSCYRINEDDTKVEEIPPSTRRCVAAFDYHYEKKWCVTDWRRPGELEEGDGIIFMQVDVTSI